jgi:hypothetical protein
MRLPVFRPIGLSISLLTLMTALNAPVRAEQAPLELLIRNHRFEPAELRVPANTKVKVIVKNLDPTPEEFESYELKREKIIPGGASVPLFIGPLAPGSYPFFGEFNQATAQGRVIAE